MSGDLASAALVAADEGSPEAMVAGLWAVLLAPSWVAAVWMWRPWRRLSAYFLGAGASLLIIAMHIASRAPELTPDIPADEARCFTFAGVLELGLGGVLVGCVAVWAGGRRAARSPANPAP